MKLDCNKRVGDGPFREMLEIAQERARQDGGYVQLHRPFNLDHIDDGNCPCGPVTVSADDITDPELLIEELMRCDG